MIISILRVFLISALILLFYIFIQGLRSNVALAKATGLRYVIVPISITSVPWLQLQPVCLPILDLLPERWTKNWLPYAPDFPF